MAVILHLPGGKGRDTIEIFQGSCQGVKALLAEDPFSPAFMPMPPPESFCGVPSLVGKAENYWFIRGIVIEEKIRQIKDNLPDFGGCRDHLVEMENCWLGSVKEQVLLLGFDDNRVNSAGHLREDICF
jgi:hypothetical protein